MATTIWQRLNRWFYITKQTSHTITMTDKDWQKKKLRIFLAYILLKPLKEVGRTSKSLYKALSKPKMWFVIFIIITGVSFFQNTLWITLLSFGMMILMFLIMEYQRGDFMKDYRMKYGKFYKK